jgi:hypothetical protein
MRTATVIIAGQVAGSPAHAHCNVRRAAAFPLFAPKQEPLPMPSDSKIDPEGEKVRGGEMSGHMRYVLGISLAAAVVAMLGIYFFFAASA